MAPRGTPKGIIAKINRDAVEIVRSERMRAMLENSGAVVIASEPAAFQAFIKSEILKWAKVVKISGATLD